MNKIIAFLSLFYFLSTAADEKPVIIQRCGEDGFFSICNDVLALVKYYDKGCFEGIEVDFQESGLYYDSKHGSNWWSYYFEPICFLPDSAAEYTEVWRELPYSRPYEIVSLTTRREAYDLIQKYIKVLPGIQNKVDQFQARHFDQPFILGFHYRGTDKHKEAPRLSYRGAEHYIKRLLKKLKLKGDYKIFVATDEESFIRYMNSQFPGKVCYVEGVNRSATGDPVHYDFTLDRYQCGEDALVDCLLLSKCDYLMRMSSNLSHWSTFFNPDLPVQELNFKSKTKS